MKIGKKTEAVITLLAWIATVIFILMFNQGCCTKDKARLYKAEAISKAAVYTDAKIEAYKKDIQVQEAKEETFETRVQSIVVCITGILSAIYGTHKYKERSK